METLSRTVALQIWGKLYNIRIMEEMSCQELRNQLCLEETDSSSELEESESEEEVSDEEVEESFLS